MTLQLGKYLFTADPLLADVQCLLLGEEFLHEHHLLVDVSGDHLLDLAFWPLALALVRNENRFFIKILKEYLWITDPNFTNYALAHGIFHHIPTHSHPVWAYHHCLALDKRSEAWVYSHSRAWHHSPLSQQVGLTATHGPQGKWWLEALWGLLSVESHSFPDRYPIPHIMTFPQVW